MKLNMPFWFVTGIAFCCLTTTGQTQAQVVPDATLPNNSNVTTDGNTNIITGGTAAGGNLFHSFEQFSVPTGSAAYFNNALDIQNIISRVTGSSISNIDGLLQANASANLFLLNPNGIIFGPNARLNIGGSFLGSTASSLNFADGTQFSATAPQTTPLLIVSVPLGLQFGGTAGSIRVQGPGHNLSVDPTTGGAVRGENPAGLQVQPGKTLTLVGSDVTLEGGNLIAEGGRISVGSVAGSGLVSLTLTDTGWTLGYSGVPTYGDIQLSRRASVDASGEGGGDIQVQGSRVTLTDGSAIFALTLGSKPGGTVTVNASDSVEVIGTSAAPLLPSAVFADTEGAGAGGDLTITTGQLLVQNGGIVTSDTYSAGDAGNLTVNADTSVKLRGTSANGLPSGLSTRTLGAGAGGDLTITTLALLVQEGAVVAGYTYDQGKAGTLAVNADTLVELSGTSAIGSLSGLFTTTQGAEAAGDLTITTGQLLVQNGAVVTAGTSGAGDGGNLTVNADTSVKLRGTTANGQSPSGLFAQVQPQATGNGGNLIIETGQLLVQNGAAVSTATSGEGSGGSLEVNASELVELRGTSENGQRSSLLTAESTGNGDAGDLMIETGKLIVRDGGNVSASTSGQGQGGTLDVTANEFVEVIGRSALSRSALSTRAAGLGDKAAGNLRINTGQLIVRDGATVSANTESGNGGNIRLQDLDLLLLRNNSRISTTAGSARGSGAGGNIEIDADFVVGLENSNITANSSGGEGGFIQITAQGVFGLERREQLTEDSDITAFSQRDTALSGEIAINTPDVDPTQGLVSLPAELVDASGLIGQGCADVGENKFTVTGRGGLPPNPIEPLSGEAVLTDLATLDSNVENRSSTAPSTNSTRESAPTQIVEANRWVINNKGEVVLTATAPTATRQIPWMTPANCHTPKPS